MIAAECTETGPGPEGSTHWDGHAWCWCLAQYQGDANQERVDCTDTT